MIRTGATTISLALAAGTSAATPQAFDPVGFFTGPTHGEGRLKELMKGERRVVVDSIGHADKDGSLILEQKVAVAGDPVRHRRWRLRQTGPGRFSGTLNDATGPVEAVVDGSMVRIHYSMKGGIRVSQSLSARPGGKAVDNRTVFTKWGIKVATLTERIDKR
jgi:hypothetical protein